MEELVEIAGGAPIFPERSQARLAKDRIVDPAEVARRDPQVIVASWCGKRMKKATIVGRPGWNRVGAVRDDRIYEILSIYILQPGPAGLTEGVRQLHEVFRTISAEPAEHGESSSSDDIVVNDLWADTQMRPSPCLFSTREYVHSFPLADQLLLDDADARREAARRNLPFIGTLGVLREAARRELLDLRLVLVQLEETSFFVDAALIESLLDEEARRKQQS